MHELNKEIDEPEPNELYDFLYRDRERIASYYAQLWNGRLLSVEELATDTERSEETIKADAQVLSSESRSVSDSQFANKRTIDMHDAATVDLLLRLAAQRAENKGAPGSIQAFTGTCFFLDHNILKYAGPAIDLALAEQTAASRQQHQISRQQRRRMQQKDSPEENVFGPIKKLLSMLEMPSGFVLRVSAELSVCGPIKDSGLDQPISSLLFRAGPAGIADTFVVGLVETFDTSASEIDSPMLRTQREMGEAVFPLLFPESALRLIPLAIYRKISP